MVFRRREKVGFVESTKDFGREQKKRVAA